MVSMNKKIMIIGMLVMLLIVTSMTGCKAAKDENLGEETIIENAGTNKLVKMTHPDSDDVFYPQMEGFRGELLQDYINQSLMRVAEKYTNKEEYSNVKIDYTVTRNDEKILSVLFKGTADLENIGIYDINILESVNLDIEKSTNEIDYYNLIQDSEEAQNEVISKLNEVALEMGLKEGFEAEGVRIYFEADDIVFFYMPLDDSAKDFVQLHVPENEIREYLNDDFGPMPAS